MQRGRADLEIPGLATDMGAGARGSTYDFKLPDVAEFFQISFYTYVAFEFGTIRCDPPINNGHVGGWEWTMDGHVMLLAQPTPTGPPDPFGRVYYEPVVTTQPAIVNYAAGSTPLIGEATTAFSGLPFLRPASMGPAPWVSDPPDPMDATLFTRDEVGVLTWMFNGWVVHELNFGSDTLYSLRSWNYSPYSVATSGSVIIGSGPSGHRRRGRVVGSDGPNIAFG